MKKTLLFFAALISSLILSAQTQQGYVKTLGRPDKAGEPLGGVSVRAKGGHNEVLSSSDGTFEMRMDGKKNGEAYALQSVQKSGYELNENDIIGRQFAFSDKVRLEIVMVSSVVLQAEKRRIEDNAYRTAERNYKAKASLVEQQLQDSAISIQQYRERMAELQDKFEKYQSLIDGLAEHYAHTDYDMLSEKDREINICIENGELEHADSLINMLFDPIDVLERNIEALACIEQQMIQAQGMLSQANEDMAAVLKQQEKDAEYLYQLFTIAIARYDNKKAQCYIETRAALDSTNVKWQQDAGRFISNYMTDYDKALSYYQIALRQASKQFGKESTPVAVLYSDVGSVCCKQGYYEKALEFHNMDLFITISIYGENSLQASLVYNSIGLVYEKQGEYDKAMEYLTKAMAIKKSISGENHPDMAAFYNNIGGIYDDQDNYEKALEFYNNSLNINKSIYSENHPNIATNYNNIGGVYSGLAQYDVALEYQSKALSIDKTIFDENHPNVARCYNNIGDTYSKIGNYEKALEYQYKALAIYQTIFGENHPGVARCYNNISDTYTDMKNYDKALEYLEKALPIWESFHGMNHPDVAKTYSNLGKLYHKLGDYGKALEYFDVGFSIVEAEAFDGDHAEYYAIQYHWIGMEYFLQGNYEAATKPFEKALQIRQTIKRSTKYGDNIAGIAIIYDHMGLSYFKKGDYKNALDSYGKALPIKIDIYGEIHADVAAIYNKIGLANYWLGDYNEALPSFGKALEIYKTLYGDNHAKTVTEYDNMGDVFYKIGDFNNAIECFNKSYQIKIQLNGVEDKNTLKAKQRLSEVQAKLKEHIGNQYNE